MKKSIKAIIVLIVALIMLGSAFGAGGYIENQKNQTAQVQNCLMLISFARDKAENEDLSDDAVMEALISNIYAAWCFCDQQNDTAAEQLHTLWNDLINEGVGDKEVLLTQLKHISESIRI